MTDTQINREVAERVMGWKYFKGNDIPEKHREIPSRKHKPSDQEVWLLNDDRMACNFCGTMPDYCTYPTASRQVIERMRELGYAVEMMEVWNE